MPSSTHALFALLSTSHVLRGLAVLPFSPRRAPRIAHDFHWFASLRSKDLTPYPFSISHFFDSSPRSPTSSPQHWHPRLASLHLFHSTPMQTSSTVQPGFSEILTGIWAAVRCVPPRSAESAATSSTPWPGRQAPCLVKILFRKWPLESHVYDEDSSSLNQGSHVTKRISFFLRHAMLGCSCLQCG